MRPNFKLMNFNKAIQEVKECYEDVVEQNERLRNKLEEYNKDSEIEKLIEEKNYAYEHSLMIMSDKELKEEEEFRDEHYESCKAIDFLYELSNNGIGTCIKIGCKKCGKWKDITDVYSW